ncbi:MAG: transporter ATP-binding protein [Subtercola sp.]|nr:transporter ATP-binding protein [Subtercola sp.]
MKVILSGVSKGENGENLPLISLSYESGAVTLVVVETAKRPTVLALLAAGRMVPDAGTITFDDLPDLAALHARCAIVDAPDVSEPVGDLTLTAVVQEELMFAERPSSRRATRKVLDELHAGQYALYEMQNVPPTVRLRILTELAVSRPGIEAIVLTSPDRHGGDPFGWWAVASDLATRGLAVLVIATESSIDVVRDVSVAFEADRLADLERKAAAQRRREEEADAAAAGSDASETYETYDPTTESALLTAAAAASAAAATATPTTAASPAVTAASPASDAPVTAASPAATAPVTAASPATVGTAARGAAAASTSETPHAHTHPHAIPLAEPASADLRPTPATSTTLHGAAPAEAPLPRAVSAQSTPAPTPAPTPEHNTAEPAALPRTTTAQPKDNA